MFKRTIDKIGHLGDVHITKNHKRHKEYKEVFDNLITSLTEEQPDIILIVGDLFHDKLNMSNEAYRLAGWFLNALTDIAPVRITMGNHDLNMVRKDRVDSIQTVVDLINNPKIKYMNQTGFYVEDNIVWVVWHHGDHFSPWNELNSPTEGVEFHNREILPLLETHGGVDGMRKKGYKFIDLYHDPVNGCKMFSGLSLEKESYITLDAFKGDHAMFGDIHLRQYFDK
jgi:predicted MPP superfamily phosphohydrolase